MVEKELIENSNTKQLRQPPSVPFLWEVRPGIPKRDWKPEASSVKPVPKPPVKLVASVPFLWEEKPGKPLPSSSQPPQDSVPLTPPANLISFPSPSVYSHSYSDDSFEADVETFGFETDYTFSSPPSLLANCLVPVTAISTAVPAEKISAEEYKSGKLEAPSSPASETDSSTSSYATGTASLVGAPFLECLFPLLPPTSGFLNKVGCLENDCQAPLEPKSKHNDRQSNSSVMVRKTPTLGELIMMSRRRSLQRKAAQMRKQNLSMVKFKPLLPICLSLNYLNATMTGFDEEQSIWMLHLHIWQQDDGRITQEGNALAKTETDVEEILYALWKKKILQSIPTL